MRIAVPFLLCLLLTPVGLFTPRAAFALDASSPRMTPVVKAVSQVAPAVVNITSTLIERRPATPFDAFFGMPNQPTVPKAWDRASLSTAEKVWF